MAFQTVTFLHNGMIWEQPLSSAREFEDPDVAHGTNRFDTAAKLA